MGMVSDQIGYIRIHQILTTKYLQDPEYFIKHVGCKPEDMTGEMYRKYYQEIIMVDPPIDGSPEFKADFLGGNLFKDDE